MASWGVAVLRQVTSGETCRDCAQGGQGGSGSRSGGFSFFLKLLVLYQKGVEALRGVVGVSETGGGECVGSPYYVCSQKHRRVVAEPAFQARQQRAAATHQGLWLQGVEVLAPCVELVVNDDGVWHAGVDCQQMVQSVFKVRVQVHHTRN